MELPKDEPKRDKGGKVTPPTEMELIAGGIAGELVGSYGAASILKHIRNLNELADTQRKPGFDSQAPAVEPSRIHAFLTSDHPSHLSKIETLEKQLEKSKRTIQLLDETDFSGTNLYDFIPKDLKLEIKEQLINMKDVDTIRKTVEAELTSSCGEVWGDYKTAKKETSQERHQTLETLLLGPNVDPDDKKSFKSVHKQLDEAQTLGELLGLEKLRLAVRAITSPVKDYPSKAMDAETILGPEFQLISAQVQHMENMLEKDWANADPDMGPMDHTEGFALVCDDIKHRMVAGDKETPALSSKQKEALEKAYTNALFSYDPNESKADRTHRKISFILAASETLELGKEALLANTLKAIRETPIQEKSEKEGPEKASAKLGSLAEEMVGTGKDKAKKTLATTLKNWSRVLVVGAGGAAISAIAKPHSVPGRLAGGLKKVSDAHHGSHEQFIQFMRENLGEMNHAL